MQLPYDYNPFYRGGLFLPSRLHEEIRTKWELDQSTHVTKTTRYSVLWCSELQSQNGDIVQC